MRLKTDAIRQFLKRVAIPTPATIKAMREASDVVRLKRYGSFRELRENFR